MDRNLPSLDEVINSVVDDVEDEAPLPAVVELRDEMGLGSAIVEVEELAPEDAGAEAVFNAAEAALYDDWQQRDRMLPSV